MMDFLMVFRQYDQFVFIMYNSKKMIKENIFKKRKIMLKDLYQNIIFFLSENNEKTNYTKKEYYLYT